MTLKQFIVVIKKESNLGLSVGSIFDIWNNSYLDVMRINDELLGIIDRIRKNYKVGLISNVNEFHAEINKKRGLFSHFNPCILSCDVGMAKPDKEIFELALKMLKLGPGECVFIDDREKHLKTAKSMGFNTMLFTGNKEFLSELKKLKIKV